MTPPGDRTEAQARRFASTGSWASPLAPDGARSISGATAHTVHRAVAGPGRPLEQQFRRPFETELGLDLGPVRVHTHPTASASARALGAKAYTIGSDIAFAPGNYQPASGVGRELLAHELAHVAQQTAAGVPVLAAFPDIGFWDVVDVVSPIGGEIGRASGLTGSDVLEGAGRYILGDTLWDVLSAFAGGFKEGLGSAPKQQLDRLSDKFDDFGITDAYSFVGGYTAGVFKGLWYELKDLFDAIRTLLGLPAALNDFLTQTLPQLAARLGKAMAGPGGLSERLKKLSDAYNRDPAAIMAQAEKLLDAARAAVLAEIRKRGRGAAARFYKFLEEPWDEIGEDVGTITGRILFEVLLAVGTDAIGNFIKEALAIAGRVATPVVEAAVDAVRALGRLATQMADWLEGLVRRVAAQGGELFDALRELVAGLRNLVSEMAPEMEAATAGGPSVPVPKGGTVLESRAVKPPARTSPATVADLKPAEVPKTVKTDAPRAPKPSKTTPKAQAPAPDPHVPPQQSDQGLRFELTEKRAARLKRVAEALNDETKWGNVTANDRLRLGRVYDELVESLARKVVPKVQKVQHYVAVDSASIAELRTGGGRVLITEGRLGGGTSRFDMLQIDFKNRTAELLDLASRPKQSHVDKLLGYKRELTSLLGFEVEAKELYYTGEGGELLETLVEVVVK